jgi:hypothetical protein
MHGGVVVGLASLWATRWDGTRAKATTRCFICGLGLASKWRRAAGREAKDSQRGCTRISWMHADSRAIAFGIPSDPRFAGVFDAGVKQTRMWNHRCTRIKARRVMIEVGWLDIASVRLESPPLRDIRLHLRFKFLLGSTWPLPRNIVPVSSAIALSAVTCPIAPAYASCGHERDLA